jgi:septal ring factor EnvC (AmiA/AmiB activator)
LRPQAQQQQQQRSLARLREQLHGCAKEAEALRRQLADRDAELAALQRRGCGERSPLQPGRGWAG